MQVADGVFCADPDSSQCREECGDANGVGGDVWVSINRRDVAGFIVDPDVVGGGSGD